MAEATNPITTASKTRVGEDVGRELERLSKAAPFPIHLRRDCLEVQTEAHRTNNAYLGREMAEYVFALVNAHRSGKLVASTGSGKKETKGTTPMGSGHSRVEPSGLKASPECPSRIPAYATDFDRISCMASRRDVEEIAQVLSTKHRGNEIYALAVIGIYRNGERVSDEHSQSEDAQSAAEGEACQRGGVAETPEATPKSSPSQTPVDPQMTVDAIGAKARAMCAEHCDMASETPCSECTAEQEHDWRGDAEAALRTLQAAGEVR